MIQIERVVQPDDIFKLLGVTNTAEAEKVMSTILSFLIYMKTGDQIQTSTASFNKIAPDLIQIDTNLDPKQIVDSLDKRRVIRFPI